MARKRGNSAIAEVENGVDLTAERKGKSALKLSPADYFDATARYPKGPGVHHRVYRLFPVIDRRLSGEEKKDILNVPDLTEARILAEFGSGHYQCYFLDDGRRPNTLATTILELDADFWDRPPVLNQCELVEGHPKNKGFIEGLKARGLWRRDQEQTERNDMATAEAAQATTTAVQELAGIAKNAMARSNETKPVEKALDESMKLMAKGYNTALEAVQSGKGGGGGDMMLIVQLMQEQSQRQHEVFMELLKQQGVRQGAPAGGIDRELSVVQKMLQFAKTLSGDGGGRPASFMDRLPEMAIPLLTALISRAAAPAPAAVPVYAPAPAVSVVPSASTVDAPAAPVQDDDSMMPMILSAMGLPPEAAPIAKNFIKVAKRSVQMFRAGVSGYAFAAEVERTEGEDTFGLIAGAGQPAIVDLLSKFTPFLGADNAALISSPEFAAWLGDFFEYAKQAGYGEEDGDGDAAPDALEGSAE